MRESLKWTLIYNKYFPSNNKTLYQQAQELHNKGRLELVKQKDYFDTMDKVDDIINHSDDVYDLLTKGTIAECEKGVVTMPQLKARILKEPHKCLTSVLSIWEDKDEITRLDCGAVEVKYLMDRKDL